MRREKPGIALPYEFIHSRLKELCRIWEHLDVELQSMISKNADRYALKHKKYSCIIAPPMTFFSNFAFNPHMSHRDGAED